MSSQDLVLAAAGASAGPTYIEDVFSTYLYTGNGSTQTINNGIDLAGEGGMVWVKSRSNAADNIITDSVRGAWYQSVTNSTAAQTYSNLYLPSLNSNGFSLASTSTVNNSGSTFVSWTFRKAPKFFDVVTYTGNPFNAKQTIEHNLGSVPGMIIVKCLNEPYNWAVYHRSLSAGSFGAKDCVLKLNLTSVVTDDNAWGSTEPTATHFTVGPNVLTNGSSGQTYVAYLFAHDAGGFGAAGTDNVISCGSFTTDSGSRATVTLGWEPQYVLVKRTNSSSDWFLLDMMRGYTDNGSARLASNLSSAESSSSYGYPTATGFKAELAASSTYIYMAIRRGPMRTPTDATKVFKPVAYNGTLSGAGQTAAITTDIRPDMVFVKGRSGANATSAGFTWYDRLRSVTGRWLMSSNSDAETSTGDTYGVALNTSNTAVLTRYSYENNYYTTTYSLNAFTRAPGFFDVVYYTGTGSATTQAHNLGVVPELMIVKSKSNAENWTIYAAPLGNTKYLGFAANGARTASVWGNTTPTATQFYVGSSTVNTSSATYVAYLFASCPGVSKVGSYSGTGTTQTISCGFSGGARFVMIQRTDTDGYGFYVWDTARGMVAGTDPSLLLNSTAAEVNDNSVYTTTGGFQIVTNNAGINANGGSYVYMAIA